MNLIEFFLQAIKLKDLNRQGWIQFPVKDSESVADHSWSAALMALVFAKQFQLNELKCIKMALIHDLAEVVVGDITPQDQKNNNISSEQKFLMEKEALEKITENLDPVTGKEIIDLWLEFEENESKEAKLVRQLDRLDLLFQTHLYVKEKRNKKDLKKFFEFCSKQLHELEFKKIEEKLKEKRKEGKKNG